MTLLLGVLLTALFPGAPAASARSCTKTCSTSLARCIKGAKQTRKTFRTACTGDAAGRRQCRQHASAIGKAIVGTCRTLRERCRTCCQASATGCDQTPVARDDARAQSQLVTTAAGGTVTTTAADGTVYALEVPAGALPEDETVTLTPLTAVGGFALGAGIVAGVHAEPSGLQFVKPATLAITLPQPPPERLIGFLYDGDGGDLGGSFVATEGATARLAVTHFSGFGAGTESSPELRALLAQSPGAASVQAANELFVLADRGVQDLQPYLDVVRRWFRQIVRPELSGAIGSDPRLRQALRDYDLWLADVQRGPLALGVAIDLDTPTRPEQSQALGLIAAAIRDAIARADARCLAQHSLAEAETALEWQVIADAADVDTPANALDLDTVLDGLCVEARYDDVTFPAPPPTNISSVLRVKVGLAFIDGVPATGDPMGVTVTPHGATVAGQAIGDTDPATGQIEFDFTPAGDRELRLDIHSCGHVTGRRRLARVCQDAFVIRGLEVNPASVTLSPGDTLQFHATLFGQAVAVTWSTTTGTIDTNGLLTAGNAPGTFEVRATNPVDGKSTAATVVIPGATTTTTTVPGSVAFEGLGVGRYTLSVQGSPPTQGCGSMSVTDNPTGGFRLFVCTDNWCGSITDFSNCAPVFDVTGSSSSFTGLMVNHTGACCRGCPGQGRGWENGCTLSGSVGAGGQPHLTASFDTDVSSCTPGGAITTQLDLEKAGGPPRCGDCIVNGNEECEPPGTAACQADCTRPPSGD